MARDSFMQEEITTRMQGWRVETFDGTYFYPGDVFDREDCEREHDGAEITSIMGYFGRYQAPGYLDATDWIFDTNRRRLAETLSEMYGD